MTFLATAGKFDWIAHCADRLVSVGGVPIERQANKTVLYRASDAIVAISFTGTAKIAGKYTDDWLAMQLGADELSDDVATCMRIGGDVEAQWMDLGRAVRRLMSELDAAWSGDATTPAARRVGFELPVSGWQIGKHGLGRPVMWRVVRQTWDASFRVFRGARLFPKGLMRVNCAPAVIDIERRITSDWFATRAPHWRNPSEMRDGLCSGIRRVADLYPGYVGRDCMVVEIPPVGNRFVSVTFDPGPDTDTTRGWYTPWLVAPRVSQQPLLVTDEPLVVRSGGFRFKFQTSGTIARRGAQSVRAQPAPARY